MRALPIIRLNLSTPKRLLVPTSSSRRAHALAKIDKEDEDTGHSSTASFSHTVSSRAHTSKGKQKANPASDAYRFPAISKTGGPPDPYEVLDLPKSASDEDIKQSYYRLALLLHPDSTHLAASPEHFSILNRAYKLLINNTTRDLYRQTGHGWTGTTAEPSNHSPFEAMMRAEVLRRARAGAARTERRRGFRDSEAGRSAWDLGDFSSRSYDRHKPAHIENPGFTGLLVVVFGLVAVAHYRHLDRMTEMHRDKLDEAHLSASHALANARLEAQLHGSERRDRIRRKVRQQKTLAEVDEMERAEGRGHVRS